MKSIDWTKWSSIAEIFSAIAIVVTLVYLSIQTQQTNRALIGATRAALLAGDQAFILPQADDPDIALAGITNDFASLSPEKLAQAQLRIAQLFRIREFAWLQYQDGLLDERTWEAFLNPLLANLGDPDHPATKSWELMAPRLDSEFVREVNRRAGFK